MKQKYCMYCGELMLNANEVDEVGREIFECENGHSALKLRNGFFLYDSQ